MDSEMNAEHQGQEFELRLQQFIQRSIEERTEDLRSLTESLQRERDTLAARLAQAEQQHATPQSALSSNHVEDHKVRQTLPKPPKFNGDKKKYPLWRIQMKNKLDIDLDAVPSTNAGRIAYVLSFLEEEAAVFAENWTNRNLIEQATPTIDALWTDLDERFIDRQRQENALTKWLAFRQTRQTFTDFFQEYEKLELESGNSKHDDDTRILNLKTRLSGELLTLVISRPRTKSYREFVQIVAEVEADLAMLKNTGALRFNPYRNDISGSRLSQQKTRQTPPTGGNAAPPKPPRTLAPKNSDAMDWESTAHLNQFQGARRNRIPLPENMRNPSQKELQARKDARACLNCGNVGHLARNCPYMPHSARLNVVTADSAPLFAPVLHVTDDEEQEESKNE